MRKLLIIGLIGLTASLGINLSNGPEGNPYQQLYDELLYPSVQVSTPSGTGSGVVIATTDEHGYTQKYAVYILSAAHVVDNASSVEVAFYYDNNNSTTITASVVATDTLKDLALLRTYTYKPYPYVAKLAPRNYAPRIFTPVWVIGCSLGYAPRPTGGEITRVSCHRDTENTEENLRDLSDSVANHWEINAPIWPGNSGGGVFLKVASSATRRRGGTTHELIGIAVWVKVCRGQLASTMGGIVTLEDIYEFLKECPDTTCRDLTRCNDQRSNNE